MGLLERILPQEPAGDRGVQQPAGARSDLRYERYTLERVGKRWVISAFEVSFDPIIER